MSKRKAQFEYSDHERTKMMGRITRLLNQGRNFKVEDDRGGTGTWIITVTDDKS